MAVCLKVLTSGRGLGLKRPGLGPVYISDILVVTVFFGGSFQVYCSFDPLANKSV